MNREAMAEGSQAQARSAAAPGSVPTDEDRRLGLGPGVIKAKLGGNYEARKRRKSPSEA